MKARLTCAVGFVILSICLPAARAQTFQSGGNAERQLEILSRKIDEQNLKIDTLSQQLLKLEQQISAIRPGVMIGEHTPAPAAAAATPAASVSADPANEHVVARGETLISIAKARGVSVDELQKFNNIEDARKLQAGQTLRIPQSGSPSPSASPAQ